MMLEPHQPVLDPARSAYAAGLNVLPVVADGTKRPAVSEWGRFKTTRPTKAEMRSWQWEKQHGYGVVAGPVSGHVESWDFDNLATFQAFCESARAIGLGGVLDRLLAGYSDATPRDGRRILVRYPETVEWRDQTLARRISANGKPETLIELPTFAIVAPSNGQTHPSGKPYRRLSGDFSSIAQYTVEEREALLRLARSFDEMPARGVRPGSSPLPTPGTRPGDRFAAATTWASILEPHGWHPVYSRGETTFWRRPGKSIGCSATTNHGGSDLLYVFSSSTVFEPERSYSKFAAFAMLEHGGDFQAAARALADRGFGEQRLPGATPSDAESTDDLALTSLETLLAEPDDAIEWEIEDLIAAGSLNLLAGKPKAGKSTLARQMAYCMATGTPFLGHACVGGLVWYLVLEDKRSEVRRHFRALGATGCEPVRFLFGNSRDLVAKLARLAARERPRAIIVDTLQRLISAKDLNDYAEVTTRLEPVLALARQTGAAVILVHHAAKAERAGIDSVLGSTALTGSVDNVFLLNRTERYRVLSSVQRIGNDLEETVIGLDEGGRLHGGQTRHIADVEHLQRALMATIEGTPGIARAELLDAVDGRKQVKLEALRRIHAELGTSILSGTGKKGDPFRYRLSNSGSRVPQNSWEPESSSSTVLVFPNDSGKKGGSQVPADLDCGSRTIGTTFDPDKLGRVLRGEE